MSDQDRKTNPSFETGRERAQDTAQAAQGAAQEATQEAKAKLGHNADKVKEQAQDLKGQVTDEAKRMKAEAEQHVQAIVGENKARAAAEVEGVAQAFHETSKRLHEEDHAAIAGYADQIGDQVDRLSGYLRDRDLGAMLGDLENVARRQPGLFIGGAVALGLVASRFLKSSSGGESRGGYGGQGRNQGRGRYGTAAYGGERSYGGGGLRNEPGAGASGARSSGGGWSSGATGNRAPGGLSGAGTTAPGKTADNVAKGDANKDFNKDKPAANPGQSGASGEQRDKAE